MEIATNGHLMNGYEASLETFVVAVMYGIEEKMQPSYHWHY